MTSDQPQPGDVWERDGERREVLRVIYWDDSFDVNFAANGRKWITHEKEWYAWQSGATLVERKEPTP